MSLGATTCLLDAELRARVAEIRRGLGRTEPAERQQALARSAELIAWLQLARAAHPAAAFAAADLSTAWLVRGQACEAVGNAAALEWALRAYAEAIAACGGPVAVVHDVTTRRALALAWMNRGNAFQARGGAADFDAAVAAYDEAIAGFEPLLLREDDPEIRNSLGAAWLNRGRALQRQASAASLRAAIMSYERAIAVLALRPSAMSRWHRINLAAAHMNLANAGLALASAAGEACARRALLTAAVAAARAAGAEIAPLEAEDGVAAEVGLKARRVLACALGECLASLDTIATAAERRAWADEVGETVESGLACVHVWESRGVPAFRPLAARLFWLGVQLYRVHQPQFLAEFVLEALDPLRRVGGPQARGQALAREAGLIAHARAAIAGACDDLRTQHRVDLGSVATTRLLETLADLDAAGRRLADLSAVG